MQIIKIKKVTPPTSLSFRFPPQLRGIKGGDGFTLVELIIVITILAILATIAFISFEGYSKNSRDTNRIATLNAIQKGLDIFQAQSGNYPQPDGTLRTGNALGVNLSTVGELGVNISKIIKTNKIPTDPLSGVNYVYASSTDGKYYQIATLLETLEARRNIINTSYAGNTSTYKAKVVGNYNGVIKFSTGGTYIANIPSLIFNTGSDLLSTGTYFVVNNNTNLPYAINGVRQNNKTGDQIIKEVTGNSGSTLTGINITTTTKNNIATQFSGTTLNNFGYDISRIQTEVLGSTTVSGVSNPFVEIKNKSVLDCANNGEVFYTTIDGTDNGIKCNNDIIICSGNSTGIIISSCNLGSDLVGTGTNSYGKYYQWGNNYGNIGGDGPIITSIPDASSYGPGNYYTSTGFIYNTNNNYDWTSIKNDNLWGANSSNLNDKKGPCPLNYHIPTKNEWESLISKFNGKTNIYIQNKLFLPFAGNKVEYTGNAPIYYIGKGYYWTNSINGVKAYDFIIDNNNIDYGDYYNSYRTFGHSIRCFKN